MRVRLLAKPCQAEPQFLAPVMRDADIRLPGCLLVLPLRGGNVNRLLPLPHLSPKEGMRLALLPSHQDGGQNLDASS